MTATMQDFKADLFRTLANPARIRILEVLRATDSLTVSEIQQRAGLTASNASQHLALMRGRGLLNVRRDGTSAWYSVADPALFDILDAARGLFQRQIETQTELLREET